MIELQKPAADAPALIAEPDCGLTRCFSSSTITLQLANAKSSIWFPCLAFVSRRCRDYRPFVRYSGANGTKNVWHTRSLHYLPELNRSVECILWGRSTQPRREHLVAFSRDPALAIWQAMKPLAEVGARTDAPDIAKIVTEAEIILFGLVRALSRRRQNMISTPDIAVWRTEPITPLTG